MKSFVIVCLCVASALGASVGPDARSVMASLREQPALEQEVVHDDAGVYSLHYVTAEGTVVSERGRLVPTAEGGKVLITEGEVSYVGDDGKTYVTKYTAGLDGFKAEGEHLPVAPKVVEPVA